MVTHQVAVLAQVQQVLRVQRGDPVHAVVLNDLVGDEVAFGSRVTFRMGGATRTLDIVGDDEAVGQFAREILRAVHREIHSTVEERFFDLLDEHPFHVRCACSGRVLGTV